MNFDLHIKSLFKDVIIKSILFKKFSKYCICFDFSIIAFITYEYLLKLMLDWFLIILLSYIIQPINNINHKEDIRKVFTRRVIKACNLSKNDYLDRCRFSKLEVLEIRHLRLSLLLFIKSFINHNYYSVSGSDSFVYF